MPSARPNASDGPATPPPPPPPRAAGLLTAQQLADHLNMPVGAIHRLSAAGRIPKYKSGHRTVRFDLDEVLAALRVDGAAGVPVAESATAQPDPGDDFSALAHQIANRLEKKR